MTTGFNWAGPSLIVHMLGGKDNAAALLRSQHLDVLLLMQDTVCDRYLFNAGRYFPPDKNRGLKMNQSSVYILGGFQTDFSRNWARENKHISAMMRESL